MVILTTSQLSLAAWARRLAHLMGSQGWSDSWVWGTGETSCAWGNPGGSPPMTGTGSSRRNFGWCGAKEKAAWLVF